jgi:hypothetical protein
MENGVLGRRLQAEPTALFSICGESGASRGIGVGARLWPSWDAALVLRRGIVLTACLLLTGCAASTVSTLPHPSVSPTGPPRSRTLTVNAVATYAFISCCGKGGILQRAESAAAVDDVNRTAVIVFTRSPSRVAGCVRRARLRVVVRHLRGFWPMGLKAYPSAIFPLAHGLHVGTWTGLDLLDTQPAGDAANTPLPASGAVWCDITALYHLWESGQPFPSLGRSAPTGTALIVEVRPGEQFSSRATSSIILDGSASSRPPQLVLTVALDC